MADDRRLDVEDDGALGDLRVLDVTCSVAGAVAGMMLGDHGADVVRLERPGDHDDPGSLAWHRSKTAVAIDLATDSGRRELHRLRDAADVLLTDSPVADVERLALDATTVAAVNELCVHVWMPAYGHVGRFGDLAADSVLLAAVSGMADLFSATWDRPVAPVTLTLAYLHGALGATTAMAGIVGRDTHGNGSAHVVSGLHAAAALLTVNAVQADGQPVRPSKTAASPLPYYRHYRCGDDRWLFLGSLHQQFFLQALAALDALDIMVMPGVDGDFSRLGLPDVAAAVIDRLDEIFASRPQAHWSGVLGEAGVPVAPVETREEWFAGEVVDTLGLRHTIDHAQHGPVTMPAVPLSMTSTPGRIRSVPSRHSSVESASLWRDSPGRSDVPGSVGHGSADRRRSADPARAIAGRAGPPLRSVRVLDASTFVAAPLSTAILGQLGADVVKVESLEGDPYRAFGACCVACNQGKRGVTIDFKSAAGLDLVGRLAASADVVVDNLRPSARRRLGFADVVARSNPSAITCSITAFGESGRWASVPGFDPLVQALSGLMIAQGGDGPPVFSPMPVHDVATSALAAFGILGALHHRARTGVAQGVNVSLAASSMLVQLGELVQFDGREPAPVGGVDWDGPHAGHRLYACGDGWIAVAHPDPSAAALLSAFGLERDDHRPAAALEHVLRATSVVEALDRLAAAGVDGVPVQSRLDLFDDSWIAQNEVFHQVPDDELGCCTVVNAYGFGVGRPVEPPRPAPRRGQHTRAVLTELGTSDDDVEELLRRGVVSEPTRDVLCQQNDSQPAVSLTQSGHDR